VRREKLYLAGRSHATAQKWSLGSNVSSLASMKPIENALRAVIASEKGIRVLQNS
jgi:hypothetical protein